MGICILCDKCVGFIQMCWWLKHERAQVPMAHIQGAIDLYLCVKLCEVQQDMQLRFNLSAIVFRHNTSNNIVTGSVDGRLNM